MDILYEWNHTILCDWFLSLIIMLLRFINSIIIIIYHYFITFYCQYFIFLCMHIHLFIHSYTDGHLGCCYLLATVNSASVNACIQAFECLLSILLYFSFAFPLPFSFSATDSLE